MPRYRIKVKDVTMCNLDAPNEDAAIQYWLDGAGAGGGYDCIEEAADENYCEPEDITATELD